MKRFMISAVATLWCMAIWGADGDSFAVRHPMGEDRSYEITYMVKSELNATVVAYEIEPYIGGDITIPAYVTHPYYTDKKEYKVIGLGQSFFRENTDLKSVSLPNTLQTIGEGAFYGCKNLRSVNFGSTVEIGEKAFMSCTSLTSLHLPVSLEKIGDYAFSGCVGLGVVIIPDKVKTIGDGAFYRCDNAKTVALGKGVTDIGKEAFIYLPDIRIPGGILTKNIFDTMYSFAVTPPQNYGMSWDFMSDIYVPEESIEKYEDAFSWSEFSPFRTLPQVFAIFYQPKYYVEEGQRIELEYALFIEGDNDVESMRWEAFNDKALALDDEFATGLKAGEMTTVTLTMTDSKGNEFQAQCQVEITKSSSSGIDAAYSDAPAQPEIFNVNGNKVTESADHLAPGIYIFKSGKETKKILVR